MWWTAITLAGVAAWFEWTYRRNRKAAGGDNKTSQLPEEPAQEQTENIGTSGHPISSAPVDATTFKDRLGASEKPSLPSEEHSLS